MQFGNRTDGDMGERQWADGKEEAKQQGQYNN
jgi:hypothetical protein